MRRRWTIALLFVAACSADLRCDPSFSCSGRTVPAPAAPGERDASFGGECEAGCVPVVVSAGAQHTCASVLPARNDGTEGHTVCWGRNDARQLGAGEGEVLSSPQRTLFIAASSVSAGVLATCAVRDDVLACWGTNAAGLLAWPDVDATYSARLPFAEVGAPLAVALGAAHACTVDTDEVVRCFGDNAFGQLGVVPDPYLAIHGSWIGLPPIRAIDAGGLRTCAWAPDPGELLCWGRELASDPEPAEVPVVIEGVGDPQAISVGATHACVVEEGLVRCWGSNADGQLGTGEVGGRSAAPTDAALLPGPARSVSAGGWIPITVAARTEIEYGAPSRAHTCALLEDGDVWCWGANDRGQLGDGTTIDRAAPVRVPLAAAASAISAGGEHTCAILGEEVSCWGDNQRGQLALDPVEVPSRPTPSSVVF